MLNANDAPTNRPPRETLDAGTYPARLVQVIDLGLQPQRPYQGQEKPPAREILTTYEFSDEFMKDENGEDDTSRPRWLSERFVLHNLRNEKAKSTSRYKAIDPTGKANGDWSRLLCTPVNVTLILNPSKKDPTRVYENIGAISPMRPKDASKIPDLKNDPVVFDLDNPNLEVFNNLPDWIKVLITSNLEFNGSKLQSMLENQGQINKPAKVEDAPEEEDAPW